jgi:hypothetical protein
MVMMMALITIIIGGSSELGWKISENKEKGKNKFDQNK